MKAGGWWKYQNVYKFVKVVTLPSSHFQEGNLKQCKNDNYTAVISHAGELLQNHFWDFIEMAA